MTTSQTDQLEKRRRLLLILSACAVTAVLLGVLWAIDPTPPARESAIDADRLDGIVQPQALDADGNPIETVNPELARGWIQISDADGNLAQQYRCSHLDPNPEGYARGWLRLTDPQLEMYEGDGTVLTLAGQEAIGFAPSTAIESGTLTGGVVIRLYRDLERDARDQNAGLEMILRTEQATFDSMLGSVTCPGRIVIETPQAVFVGHDLNLLLADNAARIAELRIREVDEVRLAEGRDTGESPRASARPAVPAPAIASNGPSGAMPAPAGSPAEAGTPSTDGAGDVNDNGPDPFYRLVLHDDVVITRGNGPEHAQAFGDELSFVFSPAGRSTRTASAREVAPARELTSTRAVVLATLASLAAPGVSMAPLPEPDSPTGPATQADPADAPLQLAPPPHPSDTIIVCSGGLSMVPVTDGAVPDNPDTAILMLGSDDPTTGIKLIDHASDATAFCQHLSYELPAGTLRLAGWEDRGVTIESPQVTMTVPSIAVTRTTGVGLIDGAGTIAVRRANESDSETDGTDRGTMTWTDRVDLAFMVPSDGDGGFGAFREAVFHGDVTVDGQTMSASGMTTGHLTANQVAARVQPRASTSPDDNTIVLERIIATGDVAAESDGRRLWGERVEAIFAESTDPASAPGELVVTQISIDDLVQLSLAGGGRVIADHIDLDPLTRQIDVSGTDIRLVDGLDVIDQVRALSIDDRRGIVTITGPGRYWRFESPAAGPAETRWEHAAAFQPPPDAVEAFRMTWQDSLQFEPTVGRIGMLEQADNRIITMRGDVAVSSPDIRLTGADRLIVAVTGREPRDPNAESAIAFASGATIDRIDADGDIEVIGTADTERIQCRTLAILMQPAPDTSDKQSDADGVGGVIPAQVNAAGAVHVLNSGDHLWSDTLQVTFVPRAHVPPDGAEETSDAGARENEQLPRTARSDVKVDRVQAIGSVQMLLASGERVFGDRLDAEALSEKATITGERVLVVTRDSVLDDVTSIEIEQADERYRAVGGGSFRSFLSPLALTAGALPEEPSAVRLAAANAPTNLNATWSDSATWERVSEIESTLTLLGMIDLDATPSAREVAKVHVGAVAGDVDPSLQSQADTTPPRTGELTLRFMDVPRVAGSNINPAETERLSMKRQLAGFAAKQNTVFEQRLWEDESRSGPSQVMYLAGNDISYDQESGIAHVTGGGQLLVRDPAGRGQSGAFSGGGVTDFTWTESLHLSPEPGDRNRVTMRGDVACRHLGLDNSVATMTGQRLAATFAARPNPAGTPASTVDDAADGPLGLGGAMDLSRLTGDGAVYVIASPREVACESFDYDPATGIATISSPPGKPPVSVLSPTDDAPVAMAGAIRWDMIRDTITIIRGSGSGRPRSGG